MPLNPNQPTNQTLIALIQFYQELTVNGRVDIVWMGVKKLIGLRISH